MSSPRFVISLDFELHWGVRDHTPVDRYRDNLLGVRKAIPAMLALFEKREIAATWATVGFLFAETKKSLESYFPAQLPTYDEPRLSPYDAMSEVGANETVDPFHFGASLVRKIASTPRQEIASHTFSHYYCLAPGQGLEQFEADLGAAAAISRDVIGSSPKSIVFPRNQFSAEHIDVLARLGYESYRGNPEHWAYAPAPRETKRRRLFRLADTYLPLNRARVRDVTRSPADVRASAFLRPYSVGLRHLDRVRRWRLRDSMQRAAREGGTFHLWWHPHNFGVNLGENMRFLESLLDDFTDLRRRFGMESVTMAAAAAAP